ncbi:uncharacterized protein [Physcomitrium patens]|uniref:uncharacterized protein isoform X2 n=1 Tax=Physcomitrium patens TaxID=3218 RepID=UPI000D15822A|nr:uncharacterized protein LOC112294660 isoform X2 [Physcomitrium patens]|eukprot:XP_024401137.1 uncharacterized protein LOC112294660 isoform X2 [Physcomitrella patens]
MRDGMAGDMGAKLYQLTTLQIRDLQSYVSRLFVLVANENSKLVFLVDNEPWTLPEYRFRPAELWQLMVTQSRVSPFANRRRRESVEDCCGALANPHQGFEELSTWSNFKNLFRSLPLVKTSPQGLHGCVAFEVEWASVRGINYSNELLTDTSVAMEVKTMEKREFDNLEQAQAWYSSERREPSMETISSTAGTFLGECSVARLSANCSEGCFCKVFSPRLTTDDSVSIDENSDADERDGYVEDDVSDYCTVTSFGEDILDSEEDFNENDQEYWTPPSSPHSIQRQCSWSWDVFKDNQQYFSHAVCNSQFEEGYDEEDLVNRERNHCATPSSDVFEGEIDSNRILLPLASREVVDMSQALATESNSAGFISERCYLAGIDDCPTETYGDVLIVFRFKDPVLPFELQKIATADPRLLKMIEAGLPSWVVFLQSYPIFCKLYRPWMRPLCATVYFIVSIVTVLIGFYDLYKNVPILKATAARLCGPLFEWIESWEMISRLKYLGTMLMLQNFEKGFRWLLMSIKAVRQLFQLLMWPFVKPLSLLVEVALPAWSLLLGVLLGGWNHLSMTLQSFCDLFSSVFMAFSSLLRFIIWPFCLLLSTVWNLGIYPILAAVWTLVSLPLQVVRLILLLAENLTDGLVDLMQFIRISIAPAALTIKTAKAATPYPSLWRALWNDIFSKVFRAIRSILNGLVAFLTACNRHRLSIYNEAVACLFRLNLMIKYGQSVALRVWQQMIFLHAPSPLESKVKVVRDQEFRFEKL